MFMWMLVMVLGPLAIATVALIGWALQRRQLPPPSTSPDPRLIEQAERIDLLEQELERLREQADFTERLLTERSESKPEQSSESGGS